MKCRDCDNDADPKYTMDFTDVEPGAYIHWCSDHGPEAHAMNEALMKAMAERPGFKEQLSDAIDEVILATN